MPKNKLNKYAFHPKQKEILLGRKNLFNVVDIRKKGMYYVIKLEEI